MQLLKYRLLTNNISNQDTRYFISKGCSYLNRFQLKNFNIIGSCSDRAFVAPFDKALNAAMVSFSKCSTRPSGDFWHTFPFYAKLFSLVLSEHAKVNTLHAVDTGA
jgi:hypothetical protein